MCVLRVWRVRCLRRFLLVLQRPALVLHDSKAFMQVLMFFLVLIFPTLRSFRFCYLSVVVVFGVVASELLRAVLCCVLWCDIMYMLYGWC